MAVADSFSQSDASQSSADAQVRADIDTGEAYTKATFNDADMWTLNKKRLCEVYQQLDLKSAQAYADLDLTRARNAQSMWEATYKELLLDQSEIRRRSMKQYDDTVTVSHQENQRTVRQGDLAADRMWNVDEVAHIVKEILTEDQPFKDAISGEVVKAISAMANKSSA